MAAAVALVLLPFSLQKHLAQPCLQQQAVTKNAKHVCNLVQTLCINYKEEDFETVLKDKGADVILDMIGGDYTEKNIRLLHADGRLVFINAMKGGKANFDAIDIMRRRLTITGSTLRNRDVGFKADLTAEVYKHVWPIIERVNSSRLFIKFFHWQRRLMHMR